MNGYFSTLRENAELLFELPANDSKLFNYLIYRASFKDTPLVQVGCLFDSLRGISMRVGMTVREIRTSLDHLMSAGLIELKRHNKRHNIRITGYIKPGLGDTISDKITTQQRQNNDKITTQLEEVRSKEVKKEIKETDTRSATPALALELEFQRLWDRYPRKLGRKAALRHFRASIKSPVDVSNCHAALDNYLQEIKRNGTEAQYIQHGSTWLNDWQSWQHAPSQHITPPRSLATPAIPSWKIIPSDDELVSQDEIKTLVSALQAGKGFPK